MDKRCDGSVFFLSPRNLCVDRDVSASYLRATSSLQSEITDDARQLIDFVEVESRAPLGVSSCLMKDLVLSTSCRDRDITELETTAHLLESNGRLQPG